MASKLCTGFRNVHPRWLSLWPVIILFTETFTDIQWNTRCHISSSLLLSCTMCSLYACVCVCVCLKHHSKSYKMCVFRRGPGDETYEDSKEHCWPAAEPGRNHVQSSRDTDQPQVDAQTENTDHCLLAFHPDIHQRGYFPLKFPVRFKDSMGFEPPTLQSQAHNTVEAASIEHRSPCNLLLHSLYHRSLQFSQPPL